MNIKNPTKSARLLAFGTVAAVGLALAGFAAPGLALADTIGMTPMTLAASSDELHVTVPTTLPMVVSAGGDIAGPASTAAQIGNTSVFGIHVQSLQIATESSFALVKQSDFSGSSASNAFWVTLTPTGGTAIDLANFATAASPTAGQWNIASNGNLGFASTGQIKNVTAALSATPLKAATLNWVFQSGTVS